MRNQVPNNREIGHDAVLDPIRLTTRAILFETQSDAQWLPHLIDAKDAELIHFSMFNLGKVEEFPRVIEIPLILPAPEDIRQSVPDLANLVAKPVRVQLGIAE